MKTCGDLKIRGINLEMDAKLHGCHYPECWSSFDRPHKLEQHLLLHNNVRIHKCNELGCNRAYSSRSHLSRHIKTSHSPDNQITDHFGCPKCSKPFANRQNLNRHIKKVHEEAEKFKCLKCSESFKKKHLLTAHMFNHTGVKAFKCEMCNALFITNYERKRHMRIHSKYTCEDCFAEFNLWSKYQDHRKTEHINKEFICDHCQRKFTKRLHIVRHMKVHFQPVKQNIYCCPYVECTRVYTRRNNLKAHIKAKHQNVTFECAVCSTKLTTKANLIKHIALHDRTPEYPKKTAKTKETGRKPRKDKGLAKATTAMKILGITKEAVYWMSKAKNLKGDITTAANGVGEIALRNQPTTEDRENIGNCH